MEKKIIFTPVAPNRNLLWLHYREDHLVLERFGSNGWESIGDTDHVTEEEFIEALKNKADLVGGKVPAEQLPSYVDDVVEFTNTINGSNTIEWYINNPNYTGKIYWVYSNSPKEGNLSGIANDKFIDFGKNTSVDDWTIITPEQGKIYVNTTTNHSYRWTGSTLVDLDKEWSDNIAEINEDALFYSAYTTAGGAKSKPKVYQEMAAAFTANWVTLDYSKLGTTLTQDELDSLKKATVVIVLNTPDVTGPLFYIKGVETESYIHFNNIQTTESGYLSVRKVQINLSTRACSRNIVSVAAPYNTYQGLGGTKVAADFNQNYLSMQEPNWVVIDYSLLETTLADDIAKKVANASILILESSGKDTTPRVFIRGGYNVDEVRFQEVSHSSNNYIAVRAIVLTKATKALSAEQTNVIQGGNSVYAYYTSAGGTKTEDEFKTAFVNLIDNGGSGGTQVYDLGSKTVPAAGPYDITAFNGTEFGVKLREIAQTAVDGTPLLIKYQIVEELDGTRYNRQIGAIPTHTFDGRLQLLTVDYEKPVILDLQGEQVDEGVYDYSFAVTELTTKTS